MTIACGDSHTSTHGAFGSIAFGIGTSQVRDVLATQTITMAKLRVRRIEINGRLQPEVYAKDVALYLIQHMGAKAGLGFAYEFGGEVVDRFSMDERMTLCNMAIEGGARCGYVNPDATTYAYLKGLEYAPSGTAWDRAIADWQSIRSDVDASYDDRVTIDGDAIEPMVTWGVLVDQSIPISGHVPNPAQAGETRRAALEDALGFMGWQPGQKIAGAAIDVAFIGSCTNGRLSDFLAVADLLAGQSLRVAPNVKAIVVPGSQRIRNELIARGIDKVSSRRRLRIPRSRLLNVPRAQSGPVAGTPGLRVVLQSQFQGTSRISDGAHAFDVAGDGGGFRPHRRPGPIPAPC